MTADLRSGPGRQRIDKWLWFVRLARTRTAAQKLAVSGRVRVNRKKNSSASTMISPGDVLTVTMPNAIRVLKVVSPGTRRGPATQAAELYQDLSPPPAPASSVAPRPRQGRPEKRDRRAAAALKRSFGDDFPRDGG